MAQGKEHVVEDQHTKYNMWLKEISKKLKRKKKKKTERGNCYISNTRKFPRVEVPESLDWKIPLSTSGNWVYQG